MERKTGQGRIDRKLMQQVTTMLREAGFETNDDFVGEHSVTVSGHKGNVRVVLHMSEREAVAFRATTLEGVPGPESIKVKAGLPPRVLARGSEGTAGNGGERPRVEQKEQT